MPTVSETRQALDWWLASDGLWYPPESKPGPPPPPQDPKATIRNQAFMATGGLGLGMGGIGDAVIEGVLHAGSVGADVGIGACSFLAAAGAAMQVFPYIRAWLGSSARRGGRVT